MGVAGEEARTTGKDAVALLDHHLLDLGGIEAYRRATPRCTDSEAVRPLAARAHDPLRQKRCAPTHCVSAASRLPGDDGAR